MEVVCKEDRNGERNIRYEQCAERRKEEGRLGENNIITDEEWLIKQ